MHFSDGTELTAINQKRVAQALRGAASEALNASNAAESDLVREMIQVHVWLPLDELAGRFERECNAKV